MAHGISFVDLGAFGSWSFTRLVLQIQQRAHTAQLLLVPDFFHSRMEWMHWMEVSKLLGAFITAGMFVKPSPDLRLHRVQCLEGQSLEESPAHRRATQKDEPALTLTPRNNLNQPSMPCPKGMSVDCGRRPEDSRRTQGETKARGEQANAAQKSLWPPGDSNQEPTCCAGPVRSNQEN